MRYLAVKQPNNYVPLNSDNHRVLYITLTLYQCFILLWTEHVFSSSMLCVITDVSGMPCVCVCVCVCVCKRVTVSERMKFGVHNPNMNVITYLYIVRLHCLIFSAVFCYCLLYKINWHSPFACLYFVFLLTKYQIILLLEAESGFLFPGRLSHTNLSLYYLNLLN